MADLNNFSFTGRLTKDAEYRLTNTGKGILDMSVAVNTGFGQYKKTLFLRAQMWGDRGQKLLQYLKKGQPIAGSGELSENVWTGRQDGQQHRDLQVDVRDIQLLSSSQKTQPDDGAPVDAGYPAPDADPVF